MTTLDRLRVAVLADPASGLFVELGHALCEAGLFAEAEQVSRGGLCFHPESATGQVALGRALLGQGRLDEAEATLGALLGAHPRYALARRWLAEVLRARGEPVRAAIVMREVTLGSSAASFGDGDPTVVLGTAADPTRVAEPSAYAPVVAASARSVAGAPPVSGPYTTVVTSTGVRLPMPRPPRSPAWLAVAVAVLGGAGALLASRGSAPTRRSPPPVEVASAAIAALPPVADPPAAEPPSPAPEDRAWLARLVSGEDGKAASRTAAAQRRHGEGPSVVGAFVTGALAQRHGRSRVAAYWLRLALDGHPDACEAARLYVEALRALGRRPEHDRHLRRSPTARSCRMVRP